MKTLITTLALLIAVPVFASVPKMSDSVRSSLDLPMGQRLSSLRKQGPDGYLALTKIMFDENETMNNRWKAVTAAARIGGVDAKPEIERALKSQTWYMRNAGLVAMRAIDQKQALTWAKQLLTDKALIVRAAAVEAIGEIGSGKDAPALWAQLNSRESFKKGQSLFIRRGIVDALSKIEVQGHEAAFMNVLHDDDETLHQPAMQALQRLTHKNFGPADIRTQRAQWLDWWKTRKG
jgi:HEAT repeat protein